MARLVWNPIVAPDIGSSAIQAQQAAGQALNQAFSGFTNVLDQYEGQRREANLAELIARQNAFADNNDVTGYTGDLASGRLTDGLSFLRSGDLAAARGFTNELRTGRNAEASFARGQVLQGREDQAFDRSEADRASGLIIAREANALREAVRTGQMTETQANARMAELAGQTQNAGQINDVYGARRAGVTDARSDENWDRDAWRYANERENRTWTVEDRNDAKAAEALITQFREFGPNITAEDVIGSDAYKKASVGVRAAVLAQFGNGGGGAPTSAEAFAGSAAPVGGSFAGSATNALDVLNYNARGGGFGAIPSNIQTYEQLDSFGTQMLRTNGVTSSASGPYQITRDTRREFGERALGPNWRSLPRSMENEDKIAQAIFEDAKRKGPAAISGRWAAIDTNEARQLARMPWEQARVVIAAQEGGAVIPSQSAVQRNGTDLAVGAAVTRAADPNAAQARTIFAGLTDDSSMTEVVRRVTAPGGEGQAGGVFAGLGEQDMGRIIREVQDRYGRKNPGARLPAAAAAAIAESSVTPFDARKDIWRGLTGRARGVGYTGGFFGSSTNTINWDQVDQRIGRLENGGRGLAEDVRNNENTQALVAQGTQGRAQLEAARSALAAQEARDLQTGQTNNPATARLRRQVITLAEQWGAGAASGESFLQAYGVPPAREPVSSGPQRSFVTPQSSGPQRSLYIPR